MPSLEEYPYGLYGRTRADVRLASSALRKLQLIELGTSQALVRFTAQQAGELIDHCYSMRQPLLKGYRTRILDGNHLGKTNPRLKVLRKTKAGAVPGQALVLLDPQRMLIDEVVLCEDGQALAWPIGIAGDKGYRAEWIDEMLT